MVDEGVVSIVNGQSKDIRGQGGVGPDSVDSAVSPLTLLWRKKRVLIAVFLTFTIAAAVISTTVLDKEYEATSTLLITQEQREASLDAVQAGEVLARTYSELISSKNVADLVARRVPGDLGGGDVDARTAFDTVSETQLVQITAVAPDATGAQALANAYAETVVEYTGQGLNEQNGAAVSVADPAVLPSQPARPRPTLYTLLAALIGLVVGAAAALLAALLDRRVRSADELTELTGVPILAHIALARSRKARKLNEEAYRVLRANLEFSRPGKPLRSVAVVSASEGEGKSSAVLYLARAVAELGDSVIVVEGDLRRPAVQAALINDSTDRLAPGLSNYLSGSVELEEVIYPTDVPGVSLVPAGPSPPSPSALFDTERGQRLLPGLSKRADLVIIDTPPVAVGADASLLAAPADETLMVVDMERSTKPALRAALSQLRLVDADLVGILLNRVKDSGSGDAYAYGYDGGDGDSKRRRDPRRRGKRSRQLEDVPGPDLLPDAAVSDQRSEQDEDDGHDGVGADGIFADAHHEKAGHRGDDR